MNYLAFWMWISVIIQIRSKSNDRIVKSDAILTKLGGKTYISVIHGGALHNFPLFSKANSEWIVLIVVGKS